jgi:NAD(P)-dependent dehydrogenase (short-subunit alcohol dehydrogenase family)
MTSVSIVETDAGRSLKIAPKTAVALVTGGARGIGRAIAMELARAGMRVCIADTGAALNGTGMDPGPAEETAKQIRDSGGAAMALSLDARDSKSARQLVEKAGEWAGELPSVLVHSAGSLRDAMIHKASDEDWSEVLGSHLMLAVELTRQLAGAMRERRWGRIVYVGGAAGLVGSVGQAAYDVAKAGLFGLMRAMALEMAGRDICVNYLVPFAWTRMTESIPPANDTLRKYLATAGGALPEDIAPVAAWLCSAAAKGISGQVIYARGAEIAIWSQPRPLARVVRKQGFDAQSIEADVRPVLEKNLVPLESEFDLFSGPPEMITRVAR